MTSLVALALATSSLYSATYASNDDMDDDTDAHDMSDDKWGRSDVRKEFNEKRKDAQKSMKEDKKDLRVTFFGQLDTTTQEEIKALHEEYEPKFAAIKADTTKTDEEKRIALKALHDELKAEVRALIPLDLQDEFDAMKGEIMEVHASRKTEKGELQAEWKNTKAEWKAKRQERRENMKGKVRVVFWKLDNVLTRFENNKTVEELVAKYTAIVAKLDEKLASMEEDTDLYTFLKSLSDDLQDRVAELQAK